VQERRDSGCYLDWLAITLFVAGVLCAVTGLLPGDVFDTTWRRVIPLLAFLGSVVILAELTADAEVFDVIAARVAIVGRGRYAALFFMCVAFASVSTMVLNLDTTAVLLTPVMLALAGRVGIAAMPLAMTTVWFANTASLILPVSNLTNLLAYANVDLTPLQWAQRMWFPQLMSIAVTMLFLWMFFWRMDVRGAQTYLPPPPHLPRDRILFRAACVACSLFVIGVLVDLPLPVVSPVCAAMLVAVYVVRRRERLKRNLIPWRLLVMVPGLFLVVGTIGAHGLDAIMRIFIGDDPGPEGSLRAAFTGKVMSNLVNNLPTYLAGEGAVVDAGGHQILALLVGVNVGPMVTPWASLATLIWFERCHARGVHISMRTFMVTGAVAATCALLATTGALIITS
jgi:arsenical pump membrane protein